jgi:hypothetical protein
VIEMKNLGLWTDWVYAAICCAIVWLATLPGLVKNAPLPLPIALLVVTLFGVAGNLYFLFRFVRGAYKSNTNKEGN